MFRRIQYSRIKPSPLKFSYAVSAHANFLNGFAGVQALLAVGARSDTIVVSLMSLAFMLGQSLGRKRAGRPTGRPVCEKREKLGRQFFF
jgi:hypothetical protein